MVLAALKLPASLNPLPYYIAIFTDNLNTIQIFKSLHANEPYNAILLCTIQTLITINIALCVWHVAGSANFIAYAPP